MKVKVFEFSRKFSDWSWKIDSTVVEDSINDWLKNNPKVKIEHILHHNVGVGFWHPAQLIVTIYYK